MNSFSLSVQWDGLTPCSHVNGHINRYRIQYTSKSSSNVEYEDVRGKWNVVGAHVALNGLTPDTMYTVKVAAVNDEGDVGLYSESVIKWTTMLGM